MLVISQGYNISQGTKALSYQTRPEESRNYYAHDGLGSVAALSNHQGKSTERYKYDAFGELRQGDLTHNPYGFTGKSYDTESGLYQFHFRKYDPATGVWTTPDPIDIVGGLNLYGYVLNDPINKIDPLGLYDLENYFYDSVTGTTDNLGEFAAYQDADKQVATEAIDQVVVTISLGTAAALGVVVGVGAAAVYGPEITTGALYTYNFISQNQINLMDFGLGFVPWETPPSSIFSVLGSTISWLLNFISDSTIGEDNLYK